MHRALTINYQQVVSTISSIVILNIIRKQSLPWLNNYKNVLEEILDNNKNLLISLSWHF